MKFDNNKTFLTFESFENLSEEDFLNNKCIISFIDFQIYELMIFFGRTTNKKYKYEVQINKSQPTDKFIPYKYYEYISNYIEDEKKVILYFNEYSNAQNFIINLFAHHEEFSLRNIEPCKKLSQVRIKVKNRKRTKRKDRKKTKVNKKNN